MIVADMGRRIRLLVILTIGIPLIMALPVNAATLGGRCTKAGITQTTKGVRYICVKSGKKYVWKVKPSLKNGIVATTTSTNPRTLTPATMLSDIGLVSPANTCKLSHSNTDSDSLVRTGFPRQVDAALPAGDVVVQVVDVDYPNLQIDRSKAGTKSLAELIQPITEGVTRYYDAVSGGKLHFVWRLPTQTVRMPQNIESYNLSRAARNNGFAFIQDVINAADHVTDFSGADFLFVVNPETATSAQIGPGTAQQMAKRWKFRTDEGDIYRSTFTGAELWQGAGGAWQVVSHEFGHSLGLPDLYRFASGQDVVGSFDLMGGPSYLGAIELTAWHKWELGFLEDSQILCLKDPASVRYWISPVSAGSRRYEALIIPTSATTAVVIESRRKERFDKDAEILPSTGGLLIYTVDTAFLSGMGPLRVLRKASSTQPTFYDAILGAGEELQVGSFLIKNVESGDWGDVVEVRRNS